MCVKKADAADGDGRCFPHMKGTQASIDMTACMTELPVEHVKQVSRDLKREGKNLPTPSEDEVVSFAMSQQFTAKYDPRIPEKKRKTWGNRWKQAEKEKPNGGEFHSWVNTMKESAKRFQFKRTLASIMIGGSLVLTSACGNIPENQKNNTPSPEVTISAPATPTTSATPNATPVPNTEALTGIEKTRKENEKIRDDSVKLLSERGLSVSDKVFKTAQGSYPKIEVSKNGEYAKFDEKTHVNNLPKGWTKKDAAEAQEWGMNFILQEVVDTPVSGAKSKAESAAEYKKWKERNADKFSSQYREAFLARSASENLFEKSWTTDSEFKKVNYSYPYDGVTPRVKAVDLVLNESETYENTDLYYSYSGTIDMNASINKNKNIEEFVTADIGYTVTKEDGDWKLSGLFLEWDFDGEFIKKQAGLK